MIPLLPDQRSAALRDFDRREIESVLVSDGYRMIGSRAVRNLRVGDILTIENGASELGGWCAREVTSVHELDRNASWKKRQWRADTKLHTKRRWLDMAHDRYFDGYASDRVDVWRKS